MSSPPATPLRQPNPNAAMDAKTMAAAAGAAGVAAAIACSKTCAADAGGGDTVRHLYRAPGLPPPRVVAAKKTCEELGIPPSARRRFLEAVEERRHVPEALHQLVHGHAEVLAGRRRRPGAGVVRGRRRGAGAGARAQVDGLTPPPLLFTGAW